MSNIAGKKVEVPVTDQEYLVYDVRAGKFEENSALIAVPMYLSNRKTFRWEALCAFLGLKKSSRSADFVKWLLKKAEENDVLMGDHKAFAKESKINKAATFDVLEVMMDMKLLRRVDRGVYVFHPSFKHFLSNAKAHGIVAIWKNTNAKI